MKHPLIALSLLAALGCPAVVSAAEDAPETVEAERAWTVRFDHARSNLVAGDYLRAEAAFRQLALDAPSPSQRDLANQLAEISLASARRARGIVSPTAIRTTGELWLLYSHAFLYGLGTGAWFALETRPQVVGGLLLPVVGFSAASIGAVALADALGPLPYGVPQAVVAGLHIGLAEGLWAVTWQRGIARVHEDDREVWRERTASSVLWGAATAGALAGGFLGAALHTTPGRASFVSSTAFWTGALFALSFAAFTPDVRYRAEHAFAGGDVGYNAGLVGGILLAPLVAPSIARVRWLDIGGVGGGLFAAGLYSILAQDAATPRATFAATAVGSLAGLGVSWILTSRMPRDVRGADGGRAPSFRPTVLPAVGGVTVGVAGEL